MSEETRQKYLIFSIGSEFYGTRIEQVREIIRYESLTPVHDTLEYVRGVINLRGKILPVMDLRLKLGLEPLDYTDRTVLIILDISGKKSEYQTALAVDAVHEVVVPRENEVNKTPELGLKLKRNYLKGIIQMDERMIMVLDINRIVSTDEIIRIKESLEI